MAREYYANSSYDRHVANVLTKANVFSHNATFVTVHRCSSAEADLSEYATITLHVTSSLVTACFERKGQRRRTGQEEVKIRRLIQQMRLPH